MLKPFFFVLFFMRSFCVFCDDRSFNGHPPADNARDSIEVNIPFSKNYFKENSHYFPRGKNGYFSLSLPSAHPTVVLLRYDEKERWVILGPNRTLFVKPETADTADIFHISGPGVAENQILKRSTPTSGLWFSAGIAESKHVYTGTNQYVYWSKDSLTRVLFPKVKQSLDSNERLIASAAVPEPVRRTLAAEVKYYYANELYKLIYGWALARTKTQEILKKEYDPLQWAELEFFGVPTRQELAISESAKIWARNYLEIQYSKRLDAYLDDTDRARGRKVYEQAIGVTWDTRRQLMKDFGQTYPMLVIERRNILPTYAEQRRLADIIYWEAPVDMALAKKTLLDNLGKDFPDSKYIRLCREKLAATERTRARNSTNREIHIIQNGDSVVLLTSLLAPYKGKVVYLDMWGTWCGPCIAELKYAATLKLRFKDKNVVFLYLDEDEDKDEQKWKDFLYAHNLTGDHLRMNQKKISRIWRELGETTAEYPRFYIFGPRGDLFQRDASRPSSGQILYAEIEAALQGQ